ncbi:keratin 2a [Neisseria meningitidis NM3081]|nr:keratin 2a [Neisseria meningitidis NM3081]
MFRSGDDLDMAGGVFNGQVGAADRRRQGIDAVCFEGVQIAPECFDFEIADAVSGQCVRFAFDVFGKTRFVGFVEDVVVVVGNAVVCAVQAEGVVAEDDVGVVGIRADVGFVAAVPVRLVGG